MLELSRRAGGDTSCIRHSNYDQEKNCPLIISLPIYGISRCVSEVRIGPERERVSVFELCIPSGKTVQVMVEVESNEGAVVPL